MSVAGENAEAPGYTDTSPEAQEARRLALSLVSALIAGRVEGPYWDHLNDVARWARRDPRNGIALVDALAVLVHGSLSAVALSRGEQASELNLLLQIERAMDDAFGGAELGT